MNKATVKVGCKLSKHFNSYEHSVEVEVCFDTPEEYDQKVKYWQAKCRKLVVEEMAKDEIKTKPEAKK